MRCSLSAEIRSGARGGSLASGPSGGAALGAAPSRFACAAGFPAGIIVPAPDHSAITIATRTTLAASAAQNAFRYLFIDPLLRRQNAAKAIRRRWLARAP